MNTAKLMYYNVIHVHEIRWQETIPDIKYCIKSRFDPFFQPVIFCLFQVKLEGMRTVLISSSSVVPEANVSLRGGSVTTTKIARTERTNTTVVSSNSKFIAR